MKYEKFIKRAGINGVVVSDGSNRKYIYYNGVAMVIPPIFADNYNVSSYKIPAGIFEAVGRIDPEYTENAAKLTLAEIPADGKAKEITRIYTDADFEFGVNNTNWSLIERNDNAFIALDDDEELVALAIFDRGDLVGIIFPIGFTISDLETIN